MSFAFERDAQGRLVYRIPANTYFAATKEEANARARSAFDSIAKTIRFCCETPPIRCCVGQYAATSITIALGTPPFTWVLDSGVLPPGLASNFADGGRTMIISGTPTLPVDVIANYTITDATGTSIQASQSLTVIGISDTSLPAATVGVAYSHQLSALGGSGSYYFQLTAGSLPDGLSLSSTGLISGLPTTAGTVAFEISLSDQAIVNPVTSNVNASLQYAYLVCQSSQINHAYSMDDFAALFATVPSWVNKMGTGYPVWSGTLPISGDAPYLYGDVGPTVLLATFPNGAWGPAIEIRGMASDGTPAYGKPIAYWRMRIYGFWEQVGATDFGWFLLWEGNLINGLPTANGNYIQIPSPIWTPGFPGMMIPSITMHVI